MNPRPSEKTLFAEALERPAGELRAAFLAAACGSDEACRRRIEALLHAADRADAFLEAPPPDLVYSGHATPSAPGLAADSLRLSPDDLASSGPPTEAVIGRYRLLEQIGEGGCGVVYMAEQEVPVRRRVALKVIKPGMDTRAVVARFEAERQALALMDHPNIARVFDGGATPAGRPYFVMELIRGVRITDYCDAADLDTPARLRLFVQVCQAVQHAHQKGIIHRDLKPSNILVTVNDGVPVPKVIDFGIAKAAGFRLTDKTVFTRFHAFLGTPAYTSPEQAQMSSLDVDTRSDVYSLGVLLYELLTGSTPFDGEELLRSGLDELRRVIREDEPPRPSTRMTRERIRRAAGKAGPSDLAPPGRQNPARRPPPTAIPTDLDWIVMKCLEKDRTRRYETVNGLAADILRHLADEPVVARPPGRANRLRKLVRRNRTAFAAVAAVTLALVAGTFVSLWYAVRARQALEELRSSAPAFAAQARALAGQQRFAEAVEKLDYAIRLRPDSVDFLMAKAGLEQSRQRFAEAAAACEAALRLDPRHAGAQTNLLLSRRLAQPDRDSPAWDDALFALYLVMDAEQRPAPEIQPLSGPVLERARRRLAVLAAEDGRPVEELLQPYAYGLLRLELHDSPVSDLGPARGLPLGRLGLARSAVSSLGPVTGLPLRSLDATRTAITDLDPLRGTMRLQEAAFELTRVTDLAPLAGQPITWLNLHGTRVADLGPLRGMPLKVLRLGYTSVTNLAPLAGLPLEELDCSGVPAVDFALLGGLSRLSILQLQGTHLASLDGLQDLRLRSLALSRTRVRDLAPLAGMPLELLTLFHTEVTDVAPLRLIPTLQSLGLPPGATNITVLRTLPNLAEISRRENRLGRPAQAAAVFWASLDGRSGPRP